MEKRYFDIKNHGFYGAYYKNGNASDKAMILILGDAVDDRMVVCGVKWMQKLGCNVMAMSSGKKDYGHHNYPLERFESAIAWLKAQENTKVGIIGGSTTGMLALIVASYFEDITLTIAMSPPDFVMEGFYRDGLDGVRERPGNNESTVSYKGQPLPYLPYAYRHPMYWEKIKEESKESGNLIASRKMFDESERLHPVGEDEKIKVENIKGKIILVGAEDDVLWDTCRYIRRMTERLAALPHECEYEVLLYEHGTHFVFPQSMIEAMLPIVSGLLVRIMFQAGRRWSKECKQTRIDIDKKLSDVVLKW